MDAAPVVQNGTSPPVPGRDPEVTAPGAARVPKRPVGPGSAPAAPAAPASMPACAPSPAPASDRGTALVGVAEEVAETDLNGAPDRDAERSLRPARAVAEDAIGDPAHPADATAAPKQTIQGVSVARSGLKVLEQGDPEDAVVVLGDPGLASPPLVELKHEPDSWPPEPLPEPSSEEDAVVEAWPGAADDGVQVLSEHNYRGVVKVEVKQEHEELSDMEADDEDVGGDEAPAEPLDMLPDTMLTIKIEAVTEDAEVDVEFDDGSEPELGAAPDAAPVAAFDAVPDATPDATPDAAPDAAPDSAPDSAPDAAPDRVVHSVEQVAALPPGWRECLVCGETQATTVAFRLHMLSRHMRPQPYTCMLCWKSFSTASDLTRHTDSNCKEVFYKCQRCDRVWSSDRHHAECEVCERGASATPRRGPGGPGGASGAGNGRVGRSFSLYECAECAATFPLLRNLTAHVKTHPDAGKPFKCHACAQCFNNSVRLMIHVRHHSPSKTTAASPAAQTRQRGPAARKTLAATGAGAAAPSPIKARRASALVVNPFLCIKPEPGVDPEPESAPSEDPSEEDDGVSDVGSDVGVDDDHDDDVDGDTDGTSFGADSSVGSGGSGGPDDEDVFQGFEDAVFQGFEDPEWLADEDDADDMYVDSDWGLPGEQLPPNFKEGWKRFHCQYCPKVFRFSHQAKVHMRTHTGERPYVCRLCDRAFRQSNHLKRHLGVTHELRGAAVGHAFRSMIALKRKRLQRERFRALTAFFAKQGALKGFAADSTADLLIDRGLGKDLSGRGGIRRSRAEMRYQEMAARLGRPPYLKGLVSLPGAPAPQSPTAAPHPSPAPAPAPTPVSQSTPILAFPQSAPKPKPGPRSRSKASPSTPNKKRVGPRIKASPSKVMGPERKT